MSDYTATPQRMNIVNLTTNVSIEPMFNPEKLEEAIRVNYAKLQVLGLDHPVQHYINTDATGFSFELYYTARGRDEDGLVRILSDRMFLKALALPRRADSITRGGPARALFVWPNFLSMTCVLESLNFSYTDWNTDGQPIAYTAKVQLSQIRDVFVGMDDVLGASIDSLDQL